MTTFQKWKNVSLLYRKISDSSKYECAKFKKTELEIFVSSNIMKGNETKDVCTNKMLL